MSIREEETLGTEWIKDRPEGLKTSEPCIGHYDRPSCTQSTEKYHCRCSARHLQMRVIEIRETSDPSRESIGKCRGIFSAYGSSSHVISYRICTSNAVCCFGAPSVEMSTSCGQRRIHSLSTFLEKPFKTNWREGVSCTPKHFFSTTFDPREWTTVVFWKEDSGRQPKLIIPENEGADETDYPSPPPNFTLFDDPDVPIGPQGPPPPGPLAPPGPSDPPGLPPGWPPAPPLAGREREQESWIHRVSVYLSDLHRPSLNLFQFQ